MCRSALLTFVCLFSASILWSKPTVRVLTTVPSPQPVGTVIGLTAVPKEEGDPMKVGTTFASASALVSTVPTSGSSGTTRLAMYSHGVRNYTITRHASRSPS